LASAAHAQGPPVADSTVPPATVLYHNFPNPFPNGGDDRTCIWFDLATGGSVELDILDLRGNTVRRLIPSADFPTGLVAGRYGRGTPGGPACDPRFSWDGPTARGDSAPAGVYLVRLRSPTGTMFRRIVFRGKGR
jgi:hypothetical protein